MVKIKICGLSRECDIEAVNAAMPDFIGFVFAKSHRQVTAQQASALRKKLCPSICAVGVFRNETMEAIQSIVADGTIDIVQLHGDEDEDFISRVKTLTKKPVIKAIAVGSANDIRAWQNTCADYLLLDNRRGGSGECFDWSLIGNVKKPFFLAGGLNIANIQAAIAKTHPFAVDISSGVETDRVKDAEKIKQIVEKVRLDLLGNKEGGTGVFC